LLQERAPLRRQPEGKGANIELLSAARSDRRLGATLARFVRSLDSQSSAASEGIDPCHSLIGNLNQIFGGRDFANELLSQPERTFYF